MNKQKKVLSVVIPAYNVAQYLNQCLGSFLEETILENVEVIIINDGSNLDDTEKIGKDFEKNYPQTFRYIYKENGGHGSVINRGIIEASGDYFRVLDGDDWFDINQLKALVQKLKSTDADIVIENHVRINDKTKKEKIVGFNIVYDNEMKMKKGINDLNKNNEHYSLHSMIIKSEILKNNNILVDEKVFYEDMEFVLYPIPYINTIIFFNTHSYYYRVGNINQSISYKGFQKNIEDHLLVLDHLICYTNKICDMKLENEIIEYISRRVTLAIMTQYRIFYSYSLFNKNKKRQLQIFDKKIMQKSPYMYDYSSEKRKIINILRKINFNFYFLFNILFKLNVYLKA